MFRYISSIVYHQSRKMNQTTDFTFDKDDNDDDDNNDENSITDGIRKTLNVNVSNTFIYSTVGIILTLLAIFLVWFPIWKCNKRKAAKRNIGRAEKKDFELASEVELKILNKASKKQ